MVFLQETADQIGNYETHTTIFYHLKKITLMIIDYAESFLILNSSISIIRNKPLWGRK